MEYELLSSVFFSNNSYYEELYNKKFNSESTYRFDFKVNSYNAFVVINNEILQKVDEIMELDKTLMVRMGSVPEIALLQYIRKCLIDEIKMTNEIEGVNSTRKEINEILNDKTEKNKRKRLYGLVKKYEKLLANDTMELNTCKEIRTLYDELVLKEVIDEDEKNAPDGKIFRKGKVFVQNAIGKKIHDGLYPEDNIIESMNEGLKILNNNNYNFFIRIAVFHYIFGYIHPFYDGNGRMSRFISSYLLSKKLQVIVSYRISYTIKDNIASYYKSFKIANDPKNRGDLTSFVIRFLDIIIKSLKDLCKSLKDRHDRLLYFGKLGETICAEDEKMENVLFILIQNSLFGDEGLTVDEIKDITELGESKVRKCLKCLDEQNMLIIEKDSRKKLYTANLDVISEFNS